ncbi:MAG TPA: hypothetical protein VGY48_34265 [Vicinamibacterales bacterium]|jgi:hypothetical protein|nr:hypothetical protein [Vicinamibacterales bacterium]
MVYTILARLTGTNRLLTLGHTIASVIIAAALVSRTAAPAAAAGASPSRVRSTDATILELLREGGERSATFRALVDAIDHSSGIVYVEFGYCAFGHLHGCMLPFIASTHGNRYLRVTVMPDQRGKNRDQLLAVIGHELRHALEVFEHPDVVDVATMEAMYQTIGTPLTGGLKGYETSAARAAGDAVLSDLLRQRRPSRDVRRIAAVGGIRSSVRGQ